MDFSGCHPPSELGTALGQHQAKGHQSMDFTGCQLLLELGGEATALSWFSTYIKGKMKVVFHDVHPEAVLLSHEAPQVF